MHPGTESAHTARAVEDTALTQGAVEICSVGKDNTTTEAVGEESWVKRSPFLTNPGKESFVSIMSQRASVSINRCLTFIRGRPQCVLLKEFRPNLLLEINCFLCICVTVVQLTVADLSADRQGTFSDQYRGVHSASAEPLQALGEIMKLLFLLRSPSQIFTEVSA